jgi:hypothetical protein
MLASPHRKIVSPLGPTKKYDAAQNAAWNLSIPKIAEFLDFDSALAASAVSKLWQKHICSFRLFIKAGHKLFDRDNFYDTQRLREASIQLQRNIPPTLLAKGVNATCIRCIDFIESVISRWRVSYATSELAASIVKDFLQEIETGPKLPVQEFLKCDHLLLGAAAILTASKFRDAVPLKVSQIMVGYTKVLTAKDILAAEEVILKALPSWIEIDQVWFYLLYCIIYILVIFFIILCVT